MYLRYALHNLEPVIVSELSESLAGVKETRSFLPGSAMRGVFVGRWCQMRSIGPNDQIPDADLGGTLSESIRFLDAHPMQDGRCMLPVPLCMSVSKHDEGDEIGRRKLMNVLAGEDLEESTHNLRGHLGLLDWTTGGITKWQTRKQTRLHVSLRGDEETDENRLFRYHALEAGQEFHGAVVVDNAELIQETVGVLQSMIGNNVYMGGSRGSGYGRCRFEYLGESDENPEAKGIPEDLRIVSKEFYLILTSDLLSRDEQGRLLAEPSVEELSARLGVEVRLKSSAVSIASRAGYNRKWGARIPMTGVVEGGSTFKYVCDTVPTQKDLANLESVGLGSRRSEGFGRFVVVNGLPFNSLLRPTTETQAEVPSELLDEAARKELQDLLDRIASARLDATVPGHVLRISDKGGNNLARELKRTQAGKVLQTAFRARWDEPSVGQKRLRSLLEQIESTGSSNQTVHQRFEDARVDGQPLKGWLEKAFLAQPLFVDPELKMPSAGGFVGKIGPEARYRFNLSLVEGVFRQVLRTQRK